MMPDYVDVLPLLTAACGHLKHNELIKSPSLTMFEATSAIEIGEPRMDAGVAIPEELAVIPFDMHLALTPRQTCEVMDGLFAAQVAWLQGASLAQTIYTCAYVHVLDSLISGEFSIAASARSLGYAAYKTELISLVLHAFLRGSLKTCDLVMEELLKGHVNDSEDYISDKAGVSLLEEVEIDPILEEMTLAQEWLTDWRGPDAETWALPLWSRLNIQRQILSCVCLYNFSDAMQDSIPPWIASAKDWLSWLLRHPLPPSSAPFSCPVGVPGAFNPYIARKLECIAPPRPLIKFPGRVETYKKLRALFDSFDNVLELLNVKGWPDIEAHFTVLARSEPPLIPYVRSLNQSIFHRDKQVCVHYNIQWLVRSFYTHRAGLSADSIEPALLKLDEPSNASVPPSLGELMVITSTHLIKYISNLGKNRAQQYRKLGNMVIHLQAAINLANTCASDMKGNSTAQSTDDHVNLVRSLEALQVCIVFEILLAGFELQLYAANELFSVYAYLAKVGSLVGERLAGGKGRTSGVIYDVSRRARSLAAMARATMEILLLSGAVPSLSTLDKTRLERRFKWAPSEGILKHTWEAYKQSILALGGNLAAAERRTRAIDAVTESVQAIKLMSDKQPFFPYMRICEISLLTLKHQLPRAISYDYTASPSPHFPIISSLG